MSNLYKTLQKIREKPGMYIGKPSLSDLFMFIVGYEFARGELEIELTKEEEDFHQKFQPWLQEKYQIKTVNSWAKIISVYSVDEKEGFEKFFKLLDEFQKRDQASETQLLVNSILV